MVGIVSIVIMLLTAVCFEIIAIRLTDITTLLDANVVYHMLQSHPMVTIPFICIEAVCLTVILIYAMKAK